jgi:hypothetical protein
VDKKHSLEHGHSINLQTAESFPLPLKPPYGIIAAEADKNKNADCFWQSAMATIFI